MLMGITFVFLCRLLVSAPSQQASAQARLQDLGEVLQAASGLQPIFRIDVSLTIAEEPSSARLVPRDELDRMLTLAAVFPLKTPMDLRHMKTDTWEWVVGNASKRGLDSLSAQVRIARLLISRGERDVEAILARVVRPSLTTLTCDDFLVPDVALYYDLVREITLRTSKERRLKGEHVHLLRSAVGAIRSPLEAGAAATLVYELRDLPHWDALLGFYSAALMSLTGDDRSFTTSIVRDGLPEGIERLAREAIRRGLSAQGIIGAYESYVRRHGSAARCESSVSDAARFEHQDPLRRLPALLALAHDDHERTPIVPKKPIPERQPETLWSVPAARAQFSDVHRVRFNAPKDSSPPDAKVQWRDDYLAVVTALEQWKVATDLPADRLFHMKTILFQSLLRAAEDDIQRRRSIQAYVRALEDTTVQSADPLGWILRLSEFAALPSPGAQNAAAWRKEALVALTVSRDITVSVYGRLLSLLGPE